MRRFWILGLLALSLGASGCATSARRTSNNSLTKGAAWANTPAPAQAQVVLPPERDTSATLARADSTGLSKYFPALKRPPVVDPDLTASTSRPGWFARRRPRLNPYQTLTSYTSSNRAGISQNGAVPSSLPVALQVPAMPRDGAVMATNVEVAVNQPATTPSSELTATPQPGLLDSPLDPSRSTPKPGYSEDVNPLPPAEEPAKADKPVNHMPEVPSVEPPPAAQPTPEAAKAADAPKPADTPKPPAVVDDAAPPDNGPAPTTPKPAAGLTTEQTRNQMPAATQPEAPRFGRRKLIATSFFHHDKPTTIYASPQSVVKPFVKPTPAPAPKPTPQSVVKPSPQTTVATVCENKNCLIHRLEKCCLVKKFHNFCHSGSKSETP